MRKGKDMEDKITVRDLLRQAMSVMGEEAGYESGYATFTVNLVNQLMIDCFECNNTRRIFAGKEPLGGIPTVKNMEDIIPFEYEVISGVMSYGLAYWLLFQDDENDKANICNANYETNKIKYAKAVTEEVEDVYGGDGI